MGRLREMKRGCFIASRTAEPFIYQGKSSPMKVSIQPNDSPLFIGSFAHVRARANNPDMCLSNHGTRVFGRYPSCSLPMATLQATVYGHFNTGEGYPVQSVADAADASLPELRPSAGPPTFHPPTADGWALAMADEEKLRRWVSVGQVGMGEIQKVFVDPFLVFLHVFGPTLFPE